VIADDNDWGPHIIDKHSKIAEFFFELFQFTRKQKRIMMQFNASSSYNVIETVYVFCVPALKEGGKDCCWVLLTFTQRFMVVGRF
jgi:hypothetical protein